MALHVLVAEGTDRRRGRQPRKRSSVTDNAKSRKLEREIVRLGRAGKTDAALSLYEAVWDGSLPKKGDSSAGGKNLIAPTTRLMNAAIDACARAWPPRVEDAFDILEKAMGGGKAGDGAARVNPNVYTAGSLMSCCARARDADRALSLLRKMQEKYGIRPNAVVYSTAISACDRSRPPKADMALKLLREATADKTVTMGVVGFNTAISALARVGDWRRAVQLLDEMEAGGGSLLNLYRGELVATKDPLLAPEVLKPVPDAITYGTVMAACERAEQWRQVLQFADAIDLKAKSDPAFAMDGLTITSALHACQQLGLADEGLRYLEMMKGLASMDRPASRSTYGKSRRGARAPLQGPDEVAYRLAISACSRAKDGSRWADGMRLLEEMEEVTGSAPDVVAYTACIAGCAQAGNWRAAFQLLDEMKARGCEPNVVTYSASAHACATACANVAAGLEISADGSYGQLVSLPSLREPKDEAVGLLRAMKGSAVAVKPNVVTYNAAIRACAEAFDKDAAFELFEDLKREGLQPTVVTYGSLMTACERLGDLAGASRVMRVMREDDQGIKPNEVIYGAAISCCRKAGQMDRTLLVLRKMMREGLSPNTATFNTVIMAQFEGKADLPSAAEVFKLMRSDRAPKAKPNRQTYSILVRGFSANLRPNDAEIILRAMQADGFTPDVDLFTGLVSAYERTGQPVRALHLMESMEEYGYDFYEVKMLNDAFKKAVKFASVVERGLAGGKGGGDRGGGPGDGTAVSEETVLFRDDELDLDAPDFGLEDGS